MTHLTGSAGHPSDDIVEGLRITVYSQLTHTGRVEDTALVTDDAGKAKPCQPHGARCGRGHSMKMRIRAPLAYSAEVVRK
jgi:hypothetical protein